MAYVAKGVQERRRVFRYVPVGVGDATGTFFRRTRIGAGIAYSNDFPSRVKVMSVFEIVGVMMVIAIFSPTNEAKATCAVRFLVGINVGAIVAKDAMASSRLWIKGSLVVFRGIFVESAPYRHSYQRRSPAIAFNGLKETVNARHCYDGMFVVVTVISAAGR